MQLATRLLLFISFGLSLTTCIGIPVSRQTVQKIMATGWDSDGVPIAIAAVAHLGRKAYPIGPEGPQVAWSRTFDGLSVIKNAGPVKVNLKMPKADFYWGSAAALPSGEGFLVLMQIVPGDLSTETWQCAIVKMDGSSQPCVWPGARLPAPYTFYLSPDGHTVRVRRQLDPDHYWFEAWDIDSGLVTPLEPVFLTFPLRHLYDPKPAFVPCDMSNSRLSPQQDSFVVVCTIGGSGTAKQTGLWIISESAEPRLILPMPNDNSLPLLWQKGDWVAEALWDSQEHYGLAWSPTGEEIYLCANPQGEAITISRWGIVKRRNLPCLSYVTWSPTTNKIVGVQNNEIQVINLSEQNSENQAQNAF